MKKTLCMLLSLVFVLSLCSCKAEKTEPVTETQTADSAFQTVTLNAAAKPDIDLTALSSTMVYSEVYNLCVKPDDYVGKTVRMRGTFQTDENEIYYFCLIQDATACCQQGLEFILAGAEYPGGYPALGTEITVQGRFETYYEGEQKYPHLVDAFLC